jgi:hypothetical protein
VLVCSTSRINSIAHFSQHSLVAISLHNHVQSNQHNLR